MLDGLAREGIDVTHVQVDSGAATGVALIGVDGEGRNMILVAPGANLRSALSDIDAAQDAIASAQVLFLQLETPMETVLHAAAVARAAGILVCLDPAPAAPLPGRLYGLVDILSPNEVEAQTPTGIEIRSIADAERAAAALQERGPHVVVVKMGDRGAFCLGPGGRCHVPAVPVTAVDTTAAGDAFVAALGVGLGEGRPAAGAVAFATRAAALKVTRMGAQVGMPTRAEVEEATRASLR